jgi:hypothetical protein
MEEAIGYGRESNSVPALNESDSLIGADANKQSRF